MLSETDGVVDVTYLDWEGDDQQPPYCIRPDQLLDHTPKAIEVGDWVTQKKTADTKLQVRGLEDDQAWLLHADGFRETVHVLNLTRTDPPT